MGLFTRYEQLPGGQNTAPLPGSGVSRMERRQLRRGIIVSGFFFALTLLILILAFRRNPQWWDPVGPFDPTAPDAGSSAESKKDDGDTLPRIDWSWDTDKEASSASSLSWWPPSAKAVSKIGSKAWLDRYPGFVHGPAPRQTWLERYSAAKSRGLIPDLPKGELVGGLANYPESLPIDDKLCSYRRASCLGPDDIVRGPATTWAINFDDGPLPPSASLYKVLANWDEKATHFWVGHNVKDNLQLAQQAAERGDHLAVHTWSHPHLTTYTNEQVLGELGWTMQIIYDVSGHLPRYYRPPFGDVDNRIRALATHVFNMTAVMWNYDSFDWSLNQTYASGDFIDPPYDWLTTEMSTQRLVDRMSEPQDVVNGEGVIVLEHELSEESVQAFTESHPQLREKGWKAGTVPDLLGLPWYQ